MKELVTLEQKPLTDLQSCKNTINTINLLGGKKSQFNDISVALISRSQEGLDQQFKKISPYLLKVIYRLLDLFSDEILKSILDLFTIL